MLFDVEADTGNRIVGYLVPDSFSATATLLVSSNGTNLASLATNENRPSVVAAGRHATGLCGFVINDAAVPTLAQYENLELSDAASGLTIYRRRPAAQIIPFKLFRLECRHVRSQDWDRQLGELFQIFFVDVDLLGRETATQTLLLASVRSSYVSARLPYREFEYSIAEEFKKICIIQDPYVELAEILLELRLGDSATDSSLDLRDQLSFGACAEYVSGFDVLDPLELRRCLVRMPKEVETILSCPLTRALSAKSQDENLSSTSVANSLESLASFDIVGIRERPETYLGPLKELVPAANRLSAIAPASIEALDLAEALRTLPSTAPLVDLDVDVYKTVGTALDAYFPRS